MIATGLPADGGDTLPPEELDRPGMLLTSTQHLVDARAAAENPTSKPHVDRWIEERADRDRPMQEAARARDAWPGEKHQPDETGVTDVASVLTSDHDQVTAMLKQLKSIPGVTAGGTEIHASRRKSLVDLITVALSRHEATEEQYFWPAVRDVLPAGGELAEAALDQEQHGKNVLHALGSVSATEERFDELAEQLDEAARKHVAFEDRVLLQLQEVMDEEQRRALGRRMLKGEQRAPTRPHPHAPKRSSTAVKAAGLGAATVDRVRGTVGERPAERRGKARQDLEAADVSQVEEQRAARESQPEGEDQR